MKSEIEWQSFRVLISGYYVHLFLKFTSKLLPAALELWKYLYIQEVTFLRQHDSMIFILGQNRIFRVIDAKMQPKLNTVHVIPLEVEPMIFWLLVQMWTMIQWNPALRPPR